MIDVSKATCATCPMYVQREESGFCVRRSPRGEVYNGAAYARWIRVQSIDWCGEHPIRRAAYELAVQAAKEARNA